MEEKLYQNIDLPQSNPLDIPKSNTLDNIEKKNLNPKILILIAFGVIILILSILSIIVTQVRKNDIIKTSPPPPIEPTPTTNDSLIPSPYQESFKNIEKSLEENLDLPAPQIDTEVGN